MIMLKRIVIVTIIGLEEFGVITHNKGVMDLLLKGHGDRSCQVRRVQTQKCKVQELGPTPISHLAWDKKCPSCRRSKMCSWPPQKKEEVPVPPSISILSRDLACVSEYSMLPSISILSRAGPLVAFGDHFSAK